MQIESLSIALRPRSAWEAIDLGTAMLRTWWQPMMRVWLVVYLPAAILFTGIFDHALWLAIFALWWTKPVYDRFMLHVLSRSVFGDTPTVGQTLRDWRAALSPGTLVSLTIGRFGMFTPVSYLSTRSFDLPVLQLEQQTSGNARSRLRVLRARSRGHALGLTVVCAHFEALLWIAGGLLLMFLQPGTSTASGFDWFAFATGRGESGAVGLSTVVFYVIAVSIIEPLYVASGFALYLNRRAQLEGWDLELGLRRLDERLQEPARARSGGMARAASIMIASIALTLVLASTPTTVQAQGQTAPARSTAAPGAAQVIKEVVSAPEFQERRMVERWRYKGTRDDPAPVGVSGWERIAQLIAEALRAAVWVLAAVAIGILLYYARRFFVPRERLAVGERYQAPAAISGLAIGPESLPADIVAQASRLIAEGKVRDGLSLLYRGALSALVHRYSVRLRDSDTEGDCARAAAATLDPEHTRYFTRLVEAWAATAYAGRTPSTEFARDLCAGWSVHFGPPPLNLDTPQGART